MQSRDGVRRPESPGRTVASELIISRYCDPLARLSGIARKLHLYRSRPAPVSIRDREREPPCIIGPFIDLFALLFSGFFYPSIFSSFGSPQCATRFFFHEFFFFRRTCTPVPVANESAVVELFISCTICTRCGMYLRGSLTLGLIMSRRKEPRATNQCSSNSVKVTQI